MRSGLHAPLSGALTVATAFGQLMASGGTRSAFSGVDFATKKGRLVYAATAGTVTYYASYKSYGKTAIVTAAGHAQTLYAPVAFVGNPRSRKVKAGEAIAATAGALLHVRAADARGLDGPAAAQLNPCGDAEGAAGTIALMGESPAIDVELTTLTLDGVALPTPVPPGYVTTPAVLSVAQVLPVHKYAFGVLEYGPAPGSYYVVLCGNVVFATGNPRAAGPFTLAQRATTPSLVFFRDAGTNGALLTTPLPAYGRSCPAPAPPSGTFFLKPSPAPPVLNVTFYQTGQTAWGYWTSPNGATGQTMQMAVGDASVVTVSPSSVPIDATPPPTPYPPPSPFYTLTAAGIGSTQVTNTNTSCGCSAATIDVTVEATPTAAPVPSPLPNTTPSPSPSPSPTASPTSTPTG